MLIGFVILYLVFSIGIGMYAATRVHNSRDYVVAGRHLPVHEYTPTQIKKAIVGKGNAAKAQVQHMVKAMLGLSHLPQEDAADALAVALCHAHTAQTLSRMTPNQAVLHQRRTRRGRLR